MATTDRLQGFNIGVAVKPPCTVASTGNLTLSSTQVVDGISVGSCERVLVKDQTDPKTNGIYEAAEGPWKRTADFDGARDAIPGSFVYVDRGLVGNNQFLVANSSSTALTIDIGATGDDVIWSNITAILADASDSVVTTTGTTLPRKLKDRFADTINILDYGSSGGGVIDNSTMIQSAVLDAEEQGKGLYIPGAASHYRITTPILVKGPVKIFGDGDNSLIKNDTTSDVPGSVTSCFLFGNGHPNLWDNLTSFACNDIVQGSKIVESTSIVGVSTGDLVFVRTAADSTSESLYEIPDFMQLNRVEVITGTTSYEMLHPSDESVTSPLLFQTSSTSVQGLLGNDLFAAYQVQTRDIAAESDVGYPFSRGGMLDCSIHFTRTKGNAAVFGNAMTNTDFKIGTAIVHNKAMDSGVASANTTVEIGRVDYADTGSVSKTQVLIAENSRNLAVRINSLNVSSAALTNPMVNFSNARKNNVYIGHIAAKQATTSMVAFTNSTSAPSQHVCEDNSFEVGVADGSTAQTRFADFDNSGGNNNRNRILGGTFNGTITTAAVTLAGAQDAVILPACRFNDGGLQFNGSETGCRIHGYFEDWIIQNTSSAHLSNELKIWSVRQQAAKAGSVYTQAVNNINTTSTSMVHYTGGALPAGTLTGAGTLMTNVRIFIQGTFVSTNDGKFIAIADDDGVISTFTASTATVGPFELKANIIVQSNARYDFVGDFNSSKATATRTGLDLANNTRKFDVLGWVNSTADTLRFLSVAMVVDTGTNGELESR